MKKRLISLLCTLSIAATFCTQTLYAADTTAVTESTAVTETNSETAAKIKALQGLGILGISKKMTYEAFVYSLAGFLYESPKDVGSAEEIARRTGMIDENDTFKPESVITVNDAVKFAVVTLGYKAAAENKGGYPEGYIGVASELGITKGVELSQNGVLTQDSAAKILYKMLDTAPMLSYYNGEDDKGYAVDGDVTLLSLNRKIYKVEGIMTADKYTSIYRSTGTGMNNSIVIDEETYATKDGCNTDFLGKSIVAYVHEEKGDKTVVYIEEDENTEIVIEADDIEEIASDFSEIEYDTGADKYKKAKLAAVPRVIFNGVFYDEYTTDDLMPNVGSITLLDNDKDGKYELIFVKSYKTVIVQSVDVSNEKIWNKYDFDGALDTVLLGKDDNVDAKIVTGSGSISALSQIKPDSVLSVAESKNGEIRPVEVVVSDQAKASGNVSAISYDKKEITVDDKVYSYTEEFEKFTAKKSLTINVGEGYVFYIDAFGNIVYAESNENVEYKLFYKAYEEDESYYVVYMDTASEWQTSKLAKRVKYNGETTNASVVYETLAELDVQVVKIKTNASGEIKKLDVAELTNAYSKTKFTKTDELTYTYRSNPNAFGMEIYIDDGAKLFVIPEGENPSREDYYVRSAGGFFSADQNYTITTYDKDEFSFSPIFSIKQTASMLTNSVNKSLFIVTSIYNKIVDDEVLPVVKGNFGSYSNITVVGSNINSYDGLKAGDVINIGTDRLGRANIVTKVTSLSEFAPITPANLYTTSTNVAGTITDLDAANGKLKLDSGKSFRISATSSVQYYTTSRNRCEAGFASDLRVGDKILFRVGWGNVADMICVRDK